MVPVLLAFSSICAGHPVDLQRNPAGNTAAPRAATSSTRFSEPIEAGRQKLRSPDARRGAYFPNIVLRSHHGKTVRFYDDLLRGKVVLINFIYTTCGDTCPLTSANLAQAQEALGEHLGRDVFMYSITLDPKTDTPEVLKQYAERFGAKSGWHFLTGKDDEIQQLRRKLGIYDRDPAIDADKSQHLGLIVYGNEATGRWRHTSALADPAYLARVVLRLMGTQADDRRVDVNRGDRVRSEPQFKGK